MFYMVSSPNIFGFIYINVWPILWVQESKVTSKALASSALQKNFPDDFRKSICVKAFFGNIQALGFQFFLKGLHHKHITEGFSKYSQLISTVGWASLFFQRLCKW